METLYHDIFMEIAPFLPEKWDKVILMANYGESSHSIYIYVKNDTVYTESEDWGYPDSQVFKLSRAIHKRIKQERSQLTGKDLWYTLTLCVDPDGSFKADYDYEDVSEYSLAYTRAWREKYLV